MVFNHYDRGGLNKEFEKLERTDFTWEVMILGVSEIELRGSIF